MSLGRSAIMSSKPSMTKISISSLRKSLNTTDKFKSNKFSKYLNKSQSDDKDYNASIESQKYE